MIKGERGAAHSTAGGGFGSHLVVSQPGRVLATAHIDGANDSDSSDDGSDDLDSGGGTVVAGVLGDGADEDEDGAARVPASLANLLAKPSQGHPTPSAPSSTSSVLPRRPLIQEVSSSSAEVESELLSVGRPLIEELP